MCLDCCNGGTYEAGRVVRPGGGAIWGGARVQRLSGWLLAVHRARLPPTRTAVPGPAVSSTTAAHHRAAKRGNLLKTERHEAPLLLMRTRSVRITSIEMFDASCC